MEQSELKSGDRRTATVLFSDMKGFTAMSEGMDPEQIDGIMTRVFARFEEIIKNYGGYVEKYIGDALVAVFGYPSVHEDDTDRALGAALDFHEMVADHEKGLQFRTGIHSGLVTTGSRGEYRVVTGHALAIASRLQHHAPPGGILVSEEVTEKASRSFRFTPGTAIDVDGKEERVIAHHLAGRSEGAFSFEGAFVGREEEVQRVLKRYMESSGGDVGAMLIAGDAGMGKTRLAVQAVGEIRAFPRFASPTVLVRTPVLRRGAFDTLRQFFTGLFSDSGAGVPFVPASVEGLSDENRLQFEEFLAGKVWESGRDSLFQTVRLVLRAMAERNPSPMYAPIVFIDVASGLSSDERDLLRFMIEDRATPFFFLLTDRTEDREMAQIFPVFEVLKLGPLSEEETGDLIHSLAPDRALDPKDIQTKSGGTPLFVEELVKFVQRGHGEDELPATINNVILASFERFPEGDREILRKASLFNTEFTEEQVAALHEATGGDPLDVEPAFRRFLGDRLLVPCGEGVCFRYGTIRNVMYRTILNHNKKVLHGIAARILQEGGSLAVRVVPHFVKAGDMVSAAEAILAESKAHQYLVEFVPHIDRILGSDADIEDDMRVRLLYAKYASLFNNGTMDGLDSLTGEIISIGFRSRDREVLARGYHLLMASATARHDRTASLMYGKKSLEYYEGLGNVEQTDNVRSFLVRDLLSMGRIEEAEAMVGRIEQAWYFDHDSANFNLSLGRFDEAYDAILRFEAEAPKQSFFSPIKFVSSVFGVLRATGQYEGIIERLPRIKEMMDPDFSHIAHLYAMISLAFSATGEKEKGKHYLRKAEYFAKQKESEHGVGAMTAEAHLAAGETIPAERIARISLDKSMVEADFGKATELLVLLGRIALGAHDVDSLRFYAKEWRAYREGPYFITPLTVAQMDYLEYRAFGDEDAVIRSAEWVRNMLELYGDRFGRDKLLRIPLFSDALKAAETALIRD